jgi:hypothetical protein
MRESACQTFSSGNFPASSVLLSHPLTEPHDLVISYKFNTLKRSLRRELRTRFKMHLSRGVLIALALGASNVAARPQFSFNLAFNIGPEEQPSRHSNPEPTTSAARVRNLHPQEQATFSGVGLAVPTTTPLLNQMARKPLLGAMPHEPTHDHQTQLVLQLSLTASNLGLPLTPLLPALSVL